jgi:alkanesulfonate monooxygenase SsuD/methylene tetrahydromethanopterin reductase-like flavin-dependent oxidoreductase (luciferase family)
VKKLCRGRVQVVCGRGEAAGRHGSREEFKERNRHELREKVDVIQMRMKSYRFK